MPRYYPSRCSESDRILRLDIMRSVYETGFCEVASCVRESLDVIANGTVAVYDDGEMLSRSSMLKLEEWATGQIERITSAATATHRGVRGDGAARFNRVDDSKFTNDTQNI